MDESKQNDNSLEAIALISGGKDSVASYHLAVKWGLNVVCAIHLTPNAGRVEADSYMYQSTGSEAACLMVKEALDVESYIIHEVSGTPMDQSSSFTLCSGDEVEDLFETLQEAKARHPRARYVISGALFSRYQASRVEYCCNALGLWSFAPLWGIDQRLVLASLVSIPGFKAVVIKTAALNLSSADLGSDLKQLVTKFLKLKSQFGLNVCGEGGEYETLCCDAPLFKKRLIFKYSTIVDGDASYLNVFDVETIEKNCDLSNPFELPLQLTKLNDEYFSVKKAAKETIGRDDIRVVDSSLTDIEVIDRGLTISSAVQAQESPGLYRYKFQNMFSYGIGAFCSSAIGKLGLLHVLVEMRNYLNIYFTSIGIDKFFTNPIKIHIQTSDIDDQQARQLTCDFWTANYDWRYDSTEHLRQCIRCEFIKLSVWTEQSLIDENILSLPDYSELNESEINYCPWEIIVNTNLPYTRLSIENTQLAWKHDAPSETYGFYGGPFLL